MAILFESYHLLSYVDIGQYSNESHWQLYKLNKFNIVLSY